MVVVLPAPLGPEQAEALAGADLEIEAVHGDDILVCLAEIANLKGTPSGLHEANHNAAMREG